MPLYTVHVPANDHIFVTLAEGADSKAPIVAKAQSEVSLEERKRKNINIDIDKLEGGEEVTIDNDNDNDNDNDEENNNNNNTNNLFATTTSPDDLIVSSTPPSFFPLNFDPNSCGLALRLTTHAKGLPGLYVDRSNLQASSGLLSPPPSPAGPPSYWHPSRSLLWSLPPLLSLPSSAVRLTAIRSPSRSLSSPWSTTLFRFMKKDEKVGKKEMDHYRELFKNVWSQGRRGGLLFVFEVLDEPEEGKRKRKRRDDLETVVGAGGWEEYETNRSLPPAPPSGNAAEAIEVDDDDGGAGAKGKKNGKKKKRKNNKKDPTPPEAKVRDVIDVVDMSQDTDSDSGHADCPPLFLATTAPAKLFSYPPPPVYGRLMSSHVVRAPPPPTSLPSASPCRQAPLRTYVLELGWGVAYVPDQTRLDLACDGGDVVSRIVAEKGSPSSSSASSAAASAHTPPSGKKPKRLKRTMSSSDVARARLPRCWINDAVINFTTLAITSGRAAAGGEARVKVFPSFLWEKMKDKGEWGSLLERWCGGWEKVAGGLVDYLVWPVCENGHWSTAVVANPGLVGSDAFRGDADADESPAIVHLDSGRKIGAHDPKVVYRVLRNFLSFAVGRKLTQKDVPGYGAADMPQQEGEDDCGVYVMMAVEGMAGMAGGGRRLNRADVKEKRFGGWKWGRTEVRKMRERVVEEAWRHRVNTIEG